MAEPIADDEQWFYEFLAWEKTTNDTIDFKCIYVDMAGDLIAGLLLSQLVYWYLLPNREGKSKLRVSKGGYLWIAKNRDDWWDEIRITPKQADRAIKLLSEHGLIEKRGSLFAGKRTVLLRIRQGAFKERWEAVLKFPKGQFRNSPKVNFEIPQRSISESPKGEDRNSPKVNFEIPQRGISITETTSEITSETTTENDMAADAAAHPVQETGGDSEGICSEPGEGTCQEGAGELPLRRQMFEALATTCAWEIGLLTDGQRGQLNQTEKRLRTLRGQTITPADVLAFGQWWRGHDWRGKQGEHPRPDQVRSEWGRFRYWQNQQAETRSARQEAVEYAERARVAERRADDGPPELVAAKRLWEDTLAELELSMDRAGLAWFKGTRAIGRENGRLTVEVENAASKDWLENRLARRISEAIKCASGGAVGEVEFVTRTEGD